MVDIKANETEDKKMRDGIRKFQQLMHEGRRCHLVLRCDGSKRVNEYEVVEKG